MPFTAFGKYEIAATTQVNGKTQAFCSDSFVYLPILRLIAVLLTVCAVMLPAVLRKLAIANKQPWWLVAPVVLASLVFTFAPVNNHFDYFLLVAVPSQMISLSLLFLIVCSFSKRRRIVSAIIILLLNAGVLLAAAAATYGTSSVRYDFFYTILSGLSWSLPVLLSLFVLLRAFTITRLAVLLTILWGLTVAGMICYCHNGFGMPLVLEFVLPLLLFQVPYISGFLLFVMLNNWCREGLIRAFGMTVRDQATT
jgi:hypothetical protein